MSIMAVRVASYNPNVTIKQMGGYVTGFRMRGQWWLFSPLHWPSYF